MAGHLFISYSAVDSLDFTLKLADKLAAGPPSFAVWLDKREIRPGSDWDEQIVEAIRACQAMIYVMTPDSVDPLSVCKNEWVRALSYKKPVLPLLLHPAAELPFRLDSREYINFTGSFDSALARLRSHLSWMTTPDGLLQELKYRLAEANRDLQRADSVRRTRIQEEIAELRRQMAHQSEIIANPQAIERRVQETIDRGLDRVRQPEQPDSSVKSTRFINPPPLVAPTWFQNRHVETRLIGDFLKDDALRLATLVGRGGIGKTAMVCRLLRALEGGRLPDDGGPMSVDGIVYLSNARSFHRVNFPDLYEGLIQLLPEETQQRLDTIYKNPQTTTRQAMESLLGAFPRGRIIVLLDNFEDVVDVATGRIQNTELDEALRALLELPPHGVKVIITTRVAARELAYVEPARQRRFDLDIGLEHPFAENVLRSMDPDGRVGLRDAPEALLTHARERTRGYPRALEHLFGILSADRDTSLQEILDNTRRFLPEKVVEVLVGEAFNRLDLNAQRVMQALAIYRYPVPSAAVDYLLQPFVPGVDSGPVLSRLVNMQFVRRDAGRYYLHQIDRDYAERRMPEGKPLDREAEPPPFSRFAALHRAAEWFKLARTPPETWKALENLAAQLSEFELRYAGQDYDTAATVLLDIDFDYLQLWGHYRLTVELHERLQGKLDDPQLKRGSSGGLGLAYHRMGQYPSAITYLEQALSLAREQQDRDAEGTCLGNLGICYDDLGESGKAIEYHEESLVITREVGNRDGEAITLGNIGNVYLNRGQTTQAVDYYEQALAINREAEKRPSEALVLTNLGLAYANRGQDDAALECCDDALKIARAVGYRLIETGAQSIRGGVYLSQGDWNEAERAFQQAIEFADGAANTQFQHEARLGLAKVNLFQDKLSTAHELAAAARQFNFPVSNHECSAVLGVAAIRQQDRDAAREAFVAALDQANELLARGAQRYAALDAKALALCGLVLGGDPGRISEAKEAYRAARAINSETGVVQRVLQLFDALAKADPGDALPGARLAAAGEAPG